ncbi:hypothetical protein SEA_PERIWINKLE_89 [Gordonia phage Periwinkle]|nr:hypothetical protein SEA_PERIWINKLE_89 [Gordonia phage Periwinkle]
MSIADEAAKLLQKHSEAADLELDAPGTTADIRERLGKCTHGCRCDDGDHENAVHDLATADVPVLLAAFEDALATIQQVRELADEWERAEAYACRNASECVRCVSFQRVVIALRRILGGES